MDTTVNGLAERYLKRLRTHVNVGSQTSLAKADALGKEAKRLELGTSEMAQIYAHSLAPMMQPAIPLALDSEQLVRADSFFERSMVPIAKVAATQARRAYIVMARADVKALALANRRTARATAKRDKAVESLANCRKEHATLTLRSNLMQQQCRQLSHQILQAQEEERKSISRELHDDISQILAGINVRLAALTFEAAASTGGFKKKIASTQRLVKKSVDVVHRFARELRPAMLDDLGLVPTMLTLMKDVRKQTGLQIHFSTSPAEQIETLTGITRTVLYRITQEALANIRKHAKATRVNVVLELNDSEVILTVHDDGAGFDPNRILELRNGRCLGIVGMRERAEMIGGSFTIQSKPTDGTTVRMTVPK